MDINSLFKFIRFIDYTCPK